MAESAGSPFAIAAGGVRVAVSVTPRAGRSRVHGMAVDADGAASLRLSVTAPPVGGAANTAVVEMLARAWGVPKSRITVVRGASSRRKMLHVAGDPEWLKERLEAWLAGEAGAGGPRAGEIR